MGLHTGIRFAEVGFLLMLIAGVWLAAAQSPRVKYGGTGAGVLLAVGAALVIVALHWGHVGV
jgi:hypothetical protein